jgi:hypothetical protein
MFSCFPPRSLPRPAVSSTGPWGIGGDGVAPARHPHWGLRQMRVPRSERDATWVTRPERSPVTKQALAATAAKPDVEETWTSAPAQAGDVPARVVKPVGAAETLPAVSLRARWRLAPRLRRHTRSPGARARSLALAEADKVDRLAIRGDADRDGTEIRDQQAAPGRGHLGLSRANGPATAPKACPGTVQLLRGISEGALDLGQCHRGDSDTHARQRIRLSGTQSG